MNKFIITTDCQRGKLSTRCTFAELAIQLENGGHKVTALARASEADYETCGWFDYAKVEAPAEPCWKYTLCTQANVEGGIQTVIAPSCHAAAKHWNCKVNYSAPFVAHVTLPNGRAAAITWGLDPVE